MGDSPYLDGTYLSHNPEWHAEHSGWKVQHILEMIQSNGLHPASVCEVGCGAGKVIDGVARQLPSAVKAVGVDVSPDAINLCRQLVDSPVTYRLENPLDPGFGPFDLLLAIDVIEHVPDYLGFLSALRPKAEYKLLHIPLDLSVQAALRPTSFTNVRERIGHLHYFTREIALAALAETGYEVLDLSYTAGAIDLPGDSVKRHLARAPRRVVSRLSVGLSARLFGGFSLLVLTR